MLRQTLLLFVCAACASAEEHAFTLRQAVDLALKENPDIVLAHLDEQKAQAAIRVAKDPFVPKVYAGSGLAKVWGYPGSIEGSAPSIIQARTELALYNRAKSYELARVRENARGASIDTQSKSDQVAYQTATLFLDAQEMARSVQSLQLEVESLKRVSASVRLQVDEGRQLPIENKRVAVDVARAQQRLSALQDDLDYAEASLAVVLGFPGDDRVRPLDEERAAFELPATERAARDLALENNKEIRKLQSQLQAKGFELKEYKSAWRPAVDLVAQYALFAKSNYQSYFVNFQRNNTELGVSIQIPVLVGSAPKGLASENEIEITELRNQMNQTRNRIELDTQKSYQDLEKATSALEVARLDLDYAREQVSLLLTQLGEGRVTSQRVDDARLTEQEKWIALYDAQHIVERARLDLARQTGTLAAALR